MTFNGPRLNAGPDDDARWRAERRGLHANRPSSTAIILTPVPTEVHSVRTISTVEADDRQRQSQIAEAAYRALLARQATVKQLEPEPPPRA